jgi:predicted ArsR family transcriptional regulator
MEGVLWYVLTGTRGGANRVRILRVLDERPRNANRIAEELDLDYTTVRHHLDVLCDNGVLEKQGGDYGAVYLPTDRARANWDVIEDIMGRVD